MLKRRVFGNALIGLSVVLLLMIAVPMSGSSQSVEAWLELEVNVIVTAHEYPPDELVLPAYWQGQYRESGSLKLDPASPTGRISTPPLPIHGQQAWGFHTCQDGQSFPIGQQWFEMDIDFLKRSSLEVRYLGDGKVRLTYGWPQMHPDVHECPRQGCVNSSYVLLPHYGAPLSMYPLAEVSWEDLQGAAKGETPPIPLFLSEVHEEAALVVRGWIGQELMLAPIPTDDIPLATIPTGPGEISDERHPCWGTDMREGLNSAEAETVREAAAAALDGLGADIGPEHVVVYYDAQWLPGREWHMLRFQIALREEDNQPRHTINCLVQAGSANVWPPGTIAGADKILGGLIQQDDGTTVVDVELMGITESEALGKGAARVVGWRPAALEEAIFEALSQALLAIEFH